VPLAHLGKYHAQYNFVGRLRTPIEILEPGELKPWVAAHPSGQVITVERNRHDAKSGAGTATAEGGPDYQAPFRGAWLQVWRGEALLAARPAPR